MSRARLTRRDGPLLWFGLFGAPLAFASLHVVGVGFNLWDCNAAGSRVDIPVTLWTAIMTGVAAAVALAAWASATFLFFATRGVGNAPPEGRIHYLATLGMALSPLFLFIILMSGLGAIALPTCHQS